VAFTGNNDRMLLASAARTVTTRSADQVNYHSRSVIVTLDVTGIVDTPSIALALELKTANGDYVVLLQGGAVTATGRHSYMLYPGGAGAVSGGAYQEIDEGGDLLYPGGVNEVDLVVGLPLPLNWRVSVVHANTDAITYSVAAALMI
jgi:hypothetical protein